MSEIDKIRDLMLDYRGKHHLSQSQFARLVGVSEPTINAFENFKRKPTQDTLYKIKAYCTREKGGNYNE